MGNDNEKAAADAPPQAQSKDANNDGKAAPPVSNYWRILAHSNAHERLLLVIALSASVGSGVPLPLMNIIFGRLVGNFNGYFAENSTTTEAEFRHSVASNSLIFVYLFIGKFVLTYISTFCFKIAGLRISASLRLHYLKALFEQPVKRLDLITAGTIASTITTSSNTIQLSIGDQISYLVSSIALVITAFVVAFVYSWQLTLATSSGLLFLLLWYGSTMQPILKIMKALETADAAHTTVASEAISNLRTVLALGAEQKVIDNHTKFVHESETASHKLAWHIGAQIAPSYFATYSCYALSFWFGLKLLREGHIDGVSEVVIVFFSVLLVTTVLGTIVRPMVSIQQAIAASETFFKMIDSETVRSEGLKAPEVSVDHDIEFQHVNFSYPSRENVKILDDLSVTFEKGKTTAIVGPSGSGKSTIVALLQRWYSLDGDRPSSATSKKEGSSITEGLTDASTRVWNSGTVSIGVDIEQLALKYLRSQIGLVQQEPFLFDDSIENNVGYGLIGTPWEEADASIKSRLIKEACEQAFADEFIQKLPNQYSTRVGEGGIQLSGGQRQRIAIARSIIKKPTILILDEATAAIDVRSERIVQQALDNAAIGRTTIVIAHRLSTIRKADKIVVLRSGHKVEEGTHSELLSNSEGLYSALVNSQQIVDEEDDETSEQDPVELTRTQTAASAGTDIQKANKDIEAGDGGPDAGSYKKKGLIRSVGLLLLEQRRWVLYSMILISAIACGAAYSLSAWLFANLITVFNLTGQALINAGNFWALMFFVLALSVSFAYFILGSVSAHMQAFTGAFVRMHYFRDSLAMPISYYDREENASGSVTQRLSTDPKTVQELLGLNGALPLVGLFNIIGSVIIAFVFGWKLTLVVLAGCFPLIMLSGFVKLRAEILSEEKNATIFQTSSRFAIEAAGAHRTVSSLCLEPQIAKKYKTLLDGQIAESTRRFSYLMFGYALADSCELLGIALAFWYGGQLLADRSYEPISFFVVYSAVVIGAQQAGQFLSIAPNVAKATASANRVLKLRGQAKNLNPKATQPNPSRADLGAKVEFQDVGFHYESNAKNHLFSHLNISIQPGQFCALVGTSGCGKSTIISLLERFYDPVRGTILFDDTDITKVDVHEYRKNIALVSQEPRLFSGTIRENLLFGIGGDVTDEQIHQACRDAEIHDFIISLPDGYQTGVGASTSTALSGGQKQRMCLARALLRKPSLLLLDEATSSLDSQSEKLVQSAIERLTNERRMTVIAVAHRLATIQKADTIFVLGERDTNTESMSGSKILEKGTHSELLARKGVYWGMVRAQALDQ